MPIPARISAALRRLGERVCPGSLTHAHRLRAALFDRSYYLLTNPDVLQCRVNPLRHYIAQGWREGRRPNALFDPLQYLAANPDVYRSGMEPLLHYATLGRTEGRRTEISCHTREHTTPRSEVLGTVVVQQTQDCLGCMLSISQHDYHLQNDAIDSLLKEEELAFQSAGWVYIHICPANPTSHLVDTVPGGNFAVNLRINGRILETVTIADLLPILSHLENQQTRMECVIHSFAGHAPELLFAVLRASGIKHPVVWLHDYFTLCPGRTLLRNDHAFCAAPGEFSAACRTCCYGCGLTQHRVRMRSFFQETQPFLLSPSQSGLDTWRQFSTMPVSGAAVIPLAALVPQHDLIDRDTGPLERPLGIAFVGPRTRDNGWKVYERLATRFAEDSRFQFYLLHNSRTMSVTEWNRLGQRNRGLQHSEMKVGDLPAAGIDVLVHWPLWPEAFCLVIYQAVAAGVLVITRRESGHGPQIIESCCPRQGIIVESEEQLISLFEDTTLENYFASVAGKRHGLRLGSGSADWLLGPDWQRHSAKAACSSGGEGAGSDMCRLV